MKRSEMKARRFYQTIEFPSAGGYPKVSSERVYVAGFVQVIEGDDGIWCRVHLDGDKTKKCLMHPTRLEPVSV